VYDVSFIEIAQPFMRYRGNKIRLDKQANAADEQPKNIMPSLAMSGGKSIKQIRC